MLAAPHRLRRSDDFRRTVRQGMRASRPTVVLHALCDPSPVAPDQHGSPGCVGTTKVGFVVSRSVGGAVVRNRVTRRLRHLLAERLEQVEPGTMLVVRANPPAASASSVMLADDVDACLASLRGTRARPPRRRSRS